MNPKILDVADQLLSLDPTKPQGEIVASAVYRTRLSLRPSKGAPLPDAPGAYGEQGLPLLGNPWGGINTC